jgi:hypothetical protein
MYSNGGFGMSHNDMAGAMRQPLASSGAGNGFSGYSTYMMGR